MGFDTALGLATAIMAVAPLSLVLEPHDLLDALPASLERTGIGLASALSLVPTIGRTFTEIRDAQQMRGWRPGGPRSWADVLVPVMLTAMESSIDLAEAMEARAFGSGRRTRYAPRSWRLHDVGVAATALIALGAFAAGRVLGVAVDWYPYPSLSIPSVNLAMVGSCLLIAVPGVRGLRWP